MNLTRKWTLFLTALKISGDVMLEKAKEILKIEVSDPYEPCAICKGPSHIKKSESVNNRSLYVRGVGQLCYNCWYSVYADASGNITYFPD